MTVKVPVGGVGVGGAGQEVRELSSVEVLLLPERVSTPSWQHHLLQPSQAIIDVGELSARGHDHLPRQLVTLVHELDGLPVAHASRVQVHVLVVVSSFHSGRSTLGGCHPAIAEVDLSCKTSSNHHTFYNHKSQGVQNL